MADGRAGYWDVDRCAWVGAEPRYVVPPAAAADPPPAGPARKATAAVPAPRPASSDDPAAEVRR